MSTNANAVLVGVTGAIYYAPAGTALPTSVSSGAYSLTPPCRSPVIASLMSRTWPVVSVSADERPTAAFCRADVMLNPLDAPMKTFLSAVDPTPPVPA